MFKYFRLIYWILRSYRSNIRHEVLDAPVIDKHPASGIQCHSDSIKTF